MPTNYSTEYINVSTVIDARQNLANKFVSTANDILGLAQSHVNGGAE